MSLEIRLQQILDYYNLSANKFSAIIGESRQVVMNNLQGKTKLVSSKIICGIAESYPNINMNWFLKGSGSMMEDNNYQLAKEETAEYNLPYKLQVIELTKEVEYLKNLLFQTQEELLKQLKMNK